MFKETECDLGEAKFACCDIAKDLAECATAEVPSDCVKPKFVKLAVEANYIGLKEISLKGFAEACPSMNKTLRNITASMLPSHGETIEIRKPKLSDIEACADGDDDTVVTKPSTEELSFFGQSPPLLIYATLVGAAVAIPIAAVAFYMKRRQMDSNEVYRNLPEA